VFTITPLTYALCYDLTYVLCYNVTYVLYYDVTYVIEVKLRHVTFFFKFKCCHDNVRLSAFVIEYATDGRPAPRFYSVIGFYKSSFRAFLR